MTSNVYEDPTLFMNVSYSNKDGEERLDRLVDIYESTDAVTGRQTNAAMQVAETDTQRHLPAFRAAFMILCLLPIIGIIVLFSFYQQVLLERDELQIKYTESQTEFMKQEGGTLCPEGWQRFRCSCYYKSTEAKNWEDSRAACRNGSADLVIINNKQEQQFVSKLNERETSWIGLQSVNINKWEAKWRWEWVDGSRDVTFTAWATHQSVTPETWCTVSMDPQGSWTYTHNGSKQWICEKEVS